MSGLTNVGALFANNIGGVYPQDQNEWPNDRDTL